MSFICFLFYLCGYLSFAAQVEHTRSQTSLSPLVGVPTHPSVGLFSGLNVEDLEREKIL